jgi:hypothetical protein
MDLKIKLAVRITALVSLEGAVFPPVIVNIAEDYARIYEIPATREEIQDIVSEAIRQVDQLGG